VVSPGSSSFGATYQVVRTILRPTLRAVTRRDWTGLEHVPATGGCVVVSNHVSHFDPLPLAEFLDAAGRKSSFLGKSELFDVPVFGALLRSAGQIPVHRESQRAGAAVTAARDAVLSGDCVVIYPEGTITRDADLWPMTGKTGLARVWWETRCPVIPVAMWGPQDMLSPYGKLPRPWRRPVMHVKAGPALDFPSDDPPEFRAMTEIAMSAITDLLRSLRDRTSSRDNRGSKREGA